MKKKTYLELLKDPRWQKMRLEILLRDNFKCRSCGCDENTLHVHHLKYTSNEPWEEESDNLITLCELCHEALHYLSIHKTIGLETFILVCKMYNEIDSDSIKKWLEECELKGLTHV
jgi:predicted restriction endonuclease